MLFWCNKSNPSIKTSLLQFYIYVFDILIYIFEKKLQSIKEYNPKIEGYI